MLLPTAPLAGGWGREASPDLLLPGHPPAVPQVRLCIERPPQIPKLPAMNSGPQGFARPAGQPAIQAHCRRCILALLAAAWSTGRGGSVVRLG